MQIAFFKIRRLLWIVHEEDRKHNVPFREIAKVRLALLQMFGWRAGSGWVVAQADTYRLTICFLSVL